MNTNESNVSKTIDEGILKRVRSLILDRNITNESDELCMKNNEDENVRNNEDLGHNEESFNIQKQEDFVMEDRAGKRERNEG